MLNNKNVNYKNVFLNCVDVMNFPVTMVHRSIFEPNVFLNDLKKCRVFGARPIIRSNSNNINKENDKKFNKDLFVRDCMHAGSLFGGILGGAVMLFHLYFHGMGSELCHLLCALLSYLVFMTFSGIVAQIVTITKPTI